VAPSGRWKTVKSTFAMPRAERHTAKMFAMFGEERHTTKMIYCAFFIYRGAFTVLKDTASALPCSETDLPSILPTR
jgi:hypothetical protein